MATSHTIRPQGVVNRTITRRVSRWREALRSASPSAMPPSRAPAAGRSAGVVPLRPVDQASDGSRRTRLRRRHAVRGAGRGVDEDDLDPVSVGSFVPRPSPVTDSTELRRVPALACAARGSPASRPPPPCQPRRQPAQAASQWLRLAQLIEGAKGPDPRIGAMSAKAVVQAWLGAAVADRVPEASVGGGSVDPHGRWRRVTRVADAACCSSASGASR